MRKRKRLYLFRSLQSDEFGLIRAYDMAEACDIICRHFGRSAEIKPVPQRFQLFVPRF